MELPRSSTMPSSRRTERGQVLVIVVFGLVALIGAAGLAIDGGNAYSDRRHAQNAADTAALAAGLTYLRSEGNWDASRQAGMDRATNNGYDDNGTSNEVQ